jgi:hypothetical protein
MKTIENDCGRSVIMCCGKKGCPEMVLVGEEKVRVTFDDGTSQELLFDEVKLFSKALDWLQSGKSPTGE